MRCGLFLVVVIYSIGNHVYGCNCGGSPGHIQHEYCKSDFAVRAKIIDKELLAGNIVYDVIVIDDFRKHKMRNGTLLQITSSSSKAECGVTNLKRNKEYLIMGQVDVDLHWFDDCNYYMPWPAVDKTCQAGSLKFGEYLKNCNVCQVTFCIGQFDCYPTPNGRGCDDHMGENLRDVCEFDGYTKCRWVVC